MSFLHAKQPVGVPGCRTRHARCSKVRHSSRERGTLLTVRVALHGSRGGVGSERQPQPRRLARVAPEGCGARFLSGMSRSNPQPGARGADHTPGLNDRAIRSSREGTSPLVPPGGLKVIKASTKRPEEINESLTSPGRGRCAELRDQQVVTISPAAGTRPGRSARGSRARGTSSAGRESRDTSY